MGVIVKAWESSLWDVTRRFKVFGTNLKLNFEDILLKIRYGILQATTIPYIYYSFICRRKFFTTFTMTYLRREARLADEKHLQFMLG